MLRIIAFLTLILILPTSSFSIGTVGVQPLNIDFELQPGKKGEFSIDVYSTSNEDTPVKVSLYDVSQREDGNVDFTDPGKSPFSCAKWIKLQKNDFIVPAGETVSLKGELLVPRDATGVKIATVMIEPAYEKKEKGITVKLRYAVIVKVKVKGKNLIESGKIDGIRMRVSPEGIPTIEATLINNSNVDYKATGKVILQDSSGKIIETTNLTTNYLEEKQKREKKDNDVKKTKNKNFEKDEGQRVFPGTKVNFWGRVSKPLKEGEYTAIVTIKFGKRTLTSKDKIIVSSEMANSLSKNQVLSSYIVKQQNIELKVPKGGSRSAFINIINESDNQLLLKLALKDVEYTFLGERLVKEAGTTAYSLSDLIILEESNLTIGPKQSKSLKFDVKIPLNFESGGRYGQIIIENDNNSEKKYIDLTLIIPDKFENFAELTGFEIKNNGQSKEAEIFIKNNSKIHIIPEGKVFILDSDENKLALLTIKGQRILPGMTLKLNGNIEKQLKSGKYYAIAEIDYGGREKIIKKIEFTVN